MVVVSPCTQQDYQMAAKLANDGVASGVVLINGLAKVSRSCIVTCFCFRDLQGSSILTFDTRLSPSTTRRVRTVLVDLPPWPTT